MSDTGIVLFSLVFIVLLMALTSFFVVETGELINQPDLNESDSPYGLDFIGEKGNHSEEPDIDLLRMVGGIALTAGGVLAAIFTGGVAIPIALSGIGVVMSLTSIPASQYSNIPVFGGFISMTAETINWIASTISSFGRLLIYDNPLMDTIPFVKFLIFIPIIFVFVLLAIRIIRGN